MKLTEGELGFGVDSRLGYMLGKRWFVSAGVEYRIVATYHHLEYTLVTLGVGFESRTPRWLREFLE